MYQNDDFGKDYVIGLRDGLGDQANKLIVVEASYETTSPTVDSQVVQIKAANPDIFINISTPKFAAQAIKWYPEGDQEDAATVFAYGVAKGLEQVLRQCKNDLTRDNVMKQAANLNFEIGIYLPGTKIKTSPTDFAPLEQLQMMRFKGESWELFGPLMSGEKNS